MITFGFHSGGMAFATAIHWLAIGVCCAWAVAENRQAETVNNRHADRRFIKASFRFSPKMEDC